MPSVALVFSGPVYPSRAPCVCKLRCCLLLLLFDGADWRIRILLCLARALGLLLPWTSTPKRWHIACETKVIRLPFPSTIGIFKACLHRRSGSATSARMCLFRLKCRLVCGGRHLPGQSGRKATSSLLLAASLVFRLDRPLKTQHFVFPKWQPI